MTNEFIRVFRAFTDPNRLQILELLCKGEQCACVLLESLKIGQPTLSHHMKILCASGIVKSRKVGTWNYYTINPDGCAHGERMLKALAEGRLELFMRVLRAMRGAFIPLCEMFWQASETSAPSPQDRQYQCHCG